MATEKKILWAVAAVASVVILGLVLWPRAKEGLAPELVRAHVAVRPADAETAVVGPVKIEAGREFVLHAVLEARDRDGAAIFYTEAPALEVDGAPVPAEALRTWDRQGVVKVFWFTVEGPGPYMKLEVPEHIERFGFVEFFRPEWPSAWTIDGRLEPRFSDSLERDVLDVRDRSFGTQRFQVRIEIFDDENDPTPRRRFVSPGGAALPEAVTSFPTVYSALPGPADPASLAFGLTQLELPPSPGQALRAEVAALARERLAFSRPALISTVVREAGRARSEVAWSDVDLADGPAWGEGEGAVGTGDLVRVGQRVVVLFRDLGTEGRLDRADLCFDYERGAAVRSLSEIFVGDGLVELARL